jgi:fimbrial chaperone protein
MNVRYLCTALVCTAICWSANAGSLRVGPVRLDLSPKHPVAILEVQNTGDAATLAQVEPLDWTQSLDGESLEPSSDLVATPLVLNLAPGETQKVRVGLRAPNGSQIERSYRVLVEEVSPTFVASAGLRFAVRISVPAFAVSAEEKLAAYPDADALSWTTRQAGPGCQRLLVSNNSSTHMHLLRTQLLDTRGEVLWEAGAPEYVLAGSRNRLREEVCAPISIRGSQLRLTTESRTIILPMSGAGMFVDVK